MSEITIVNVGYRSTNYWVVSAGRSRLLVDLGWPGTMGRMRAALKRMDQARFLELVSDQAGSLAQRSECGKIIQWKPG